jgi:hypothetical protein
MSRETILETHMLFVGEEFYCFWPCENKSYCLEKRECITILPSGN